MSGNDDIIITGLSFFRILWYTVEEVIDLKRIFALLMVMMILLSGCGKPAADDNKPQEPVQEQNQPAQNADTETEEVPQTEAAEPATEATEPAFDPYAIMAEMTVEEKIGQLFLARCPGVEEGADDVQQYHLGGYILFGRDFDDQSIGAMQRTISEYQAAAKIPLLIAVDEEGGTVNRVSSHSQFRESSFPSPRKLYGEGGLELVLETEKEKCMLLTALGINVNMAPVCDITTNSGAFMYSRSLGESPEVTGDYIANMVKTMSAYNVGGVLKHFPGYGNNADTHVQIAVDSRSLEELTSYDLVPFQSGIDAGCDAILVSHTIVECLDDELPASLSPDVIHHLRNVMGFDGVVVTDDLKMAAITDQYGTGEAAVMAIQADADLLCSSYYWTQYNAVLEAYYDGRISQAEIEDSVVRILNWKHELGLID